MLSEVRPYRTGFPRRTMLLGAISGALDCGVQPQMSEFLAELQRYDELRPLEGVGHVPWDEAPDRFDAHLRQALARSA
jgi:pimeloyl-ACP methyl ester carboxylesterase